MVRVALRGLLAHKGRLAITFVAVALGVAFMGGVLVLTDTMNRTFDDLFADVFRDTDAVVRSDQAIDTGFGGEVRGHIDEALLAEVEAVDGVAAAAGNTEGFAQVIGKDGEPHGDPAMGAVTIGINWVADERLNPFDLVEGRAPRDGREVVLDRGTAQDTGYRLGQAVPVQTQAGTERYELVGVARFGATDSPAGQSFVMWTAAAAQRLVGQEGRYTAIAVLADDGVSQRRLAGGIRAALDRAGVDDVEVVTGADATAETQSRFKDQLAPFTTFLLAFALVALFVGTFVIYNSFSIIVAQRTREMALLRAIGARRRQVRRSVLVEAVAVGLVGSAVGFLVGLALASVLGSVFDLPPGALAVLPLSVGVAVVTGIVVTVVSALLPAWRASRVAPLAAMREVAVDRTGHSQARFLAGGVVVGLGVLVVVAGALGGEPARVGIGAVVVFAGLLLVSPGLARPVSRVLGAPLARLRGVAGALARDNAGRNPRRTSATAQALMIGVGLVAFILVVQSSVRASIDEVLDESFAGDFIIDSGTFGLIGLPPRVAREVADLPDVAVVAPVRFAQATVAVPGRGVDDTAVTGATEGVFDLLDLVVTTGRARLAPGEVVIAQSRADEAGLELGDEVTVTFLDDRRPAGARAATVAGIYDDESPTGGVGNFVLGLDDFTAAVPTSADAQVVVQLREGVPVAEAEPEIERIVERSGAAEVQSVDEYKEVVGSQIDQVLVLVGGLLALAVIIALLGIANTIALSVLERTRELGLLRAVGMRRRQVRATIRWEAAIISLFGTTLGLFFGLVGGWGIVRALRDQGFGVFEVPVARFVALAVSAVVLGLVAAVVPAWRAGRMNVLEAIGTE